MSIKLGDPLDPETMMGPIANHAQFKTVLEYIHKGIKEGATLIAGGTTKPEGLEKGFFVRPTVFSDVSRSMSIAKEEIFGLVLSIMTYKTEAEAIEIANSTTYGLLGMVWSADEERAKNVAVQIDSGQICINGGLTNELAPRGGHKQSGLGYENGKVAIEEYLEYKTLNF